jgi:hypothetical protein
MRGKREGVKRSEAGGRTLMSESRRGQSGKAERAEMGKGCPLTEEESLISPLYSLVMETFLANAC